jgi:hypothetical protein
MMTVFPNLICARNHSVFEKFKKVLINEATRILLDHKS